MTARVLFVSSHARLGGAERYLGDLVTNLGDEWVAGVVALERGPAVERLRAKGVQVEVVPCGSSALSVLSAGLRLGRSIRRISPDVVHANGVKAAIVCIAALTRTPLVWVKHDFSWDGVVTRWVARRCRRVVGVSAAVLRPLGSHARHVVVHPGLPPVTPDVDAGRERLAAAIGDSRDVVMLVGRTHPVKAHRDLIEITPMLASSVQDVTIVFVGGEDPDHLEYAEEMRRLARMTDAGRIVWLGERPDALDLIAAAAVLVVPTGGDASAPHGEGFGYTALEAMAVGTPVAGYRHGGLPEVTGECVELVRPGAKQELARLIVGLLQDGARRQAAAACGRDRAVTVLSLDRCLERMREVYREARR